MAIKAAKNARIYVSGYDLSGFANRIALALPRDYEDCTCFGDDGHKWAPILENNSLTFEAFYTGEAAGEVTERLNAYRGNTAALVSIIMGTAQEAKAIAGDGLYQNDYPIEVPVEGLIKTTGSFNFDQRATGGYLLQPKATKTSDGNGDVVDDGASSSDGCEAYLHVFACGADDDLIVKVQTDTTVGFGSPTDLITFTTATGVTAEKKSTSGAVERYVRVSWSGTPTYSATFAVIWCRL